MSTPLLLLEAPVPPAEYTRLAGTSFPAIRVEAGKTYALTGPNGSGKSTLLRMLAGLLSSGGREPQLVSGCRVLLVPTDLRQLLMPWHTIETNVSVLMRRSSSKERTSTAEHSETAALAKAREILPEAKIEDCLGNRPGQLSSGQRAAICLGIALELNPEVLLLDETLSNLSLDGIANALKLVLERAQRGHSTVLTTHSRGLVNDYALQEIQLN